MNPDRLPDLADQLRDLADRLDTEGTAVLTRADDWRPGPQPGDNHSTPPQPGDPDHQPPAIPVEPDATLTDERRQDLAAERTATRIYDKLHAYLDQLAADAAAVDRLLDVLALKRPTRDRIALTNPGDGACHSCWRTGTFEPIAMRPDGTARYRDACLWCGNWTAANDGQPPPIELVRWRHRNPGRRLTTDVVARLTP